MTIAKPVKNPRDIATGDMEDSELVAFQRTADGFGKSRSVRILGWAGLTNGAVFGDFDGDGLDDFTAGGQIFKNYGPANGFQIISAGRDKFFGWPGLWASNAGTVDSPFATLAHQLEGVHRGRSGLGPTRMSGSQACSLRGIIHSNGKSRSD